ncbi:hypothetical protein VHUM_01416 [Vanrija humicola]|uniref:Uncharacterized protein n=1 Tax=Vanrija humicola TaxID=5417 RepID=A0A7D8ZC41_VANHU|nr:hypothetical protein VHUM_01416 [Vanrija humicola]
MGPIVGQWLRFLEYSVPMRAGQAVQVTVKRVLLDQIVFAPVGLTLFVGSMGVMEGRSRAQIKQKFDDVYWTALKTNWKVWPAIQAANLGVVPHRYRLPFQQTCGIMWNTYLSLLNSRWVGLVGALLTGQAKPGIGAVEEARRCRRPGSPDIGGIGQHDASNASRRVGTSKRHP